jgi:hypothetical protein
MHALIKNGVVTNIVLWDGYPENWPADAALPIAVGDAEVRIGYLYDGVTFSAPAVPAEDPATVKQRIWEQIKAERDRRTQSSGFLVGAKWYHSDPASKVQHLGNKDTARDQLAGGGAMADPLLDPVTGQQIVWKTMSGAWQPLTCQLAFDVVKAGKGAEFAHYQAAEAHRVAMEASADPAAYDFSGGWPPAFGEE